MNLKRQYFVPGKRIEQFGRLGVHSFFTRRKDQSARSPAVRPLLARISENMGALFSIAVSGLLLILIAALVYAFVREIRRDSMQLDGFTAPRNLTERGYSSGAIAEQLQDEIRRIQRTVWANQANRQLESVSSVPDIQSAAGGLSMKSVVRYARRLFDLPDNRIAGEILQDGEALRMALRIRDGAKLDVTLVERADGNVDGLLRDAARAIARVIDPYRLARYLYQSEWESREFRETLTVIDHMLSHPPPTDDALAFELLGDVRAAQGKAAAATDAYRRAMKLSDATNARVSLAMLQNAQGQPEEALRTLREGVVTSPPTVGELTDLAHALAYLGYPDEMLDAARKAIVRDPRSSYAHAMLAWALNLKHRPAEALHAYQAGRRLAKDHDFDSRMGGIETASLTHLGQREDAFRLADARAMAAPDNVWHLYRRTGLATAIGRPEEALAAFPGLVGRQLPPGMVDADWGNALLAAGRIDEAKGKFESAIRENPRWVHAYVGLAHALVDAGKPADALAQFAIAVRLDPDDVDIWQAWAATLDRLGRGPEAAVKRAEAQRVADRLKVPLDLPELR